MTKRTPAAKSNAEAPTPKKKAPARPDVQLFIAEYKVDRNGRRAAIAAGYSPKSAASQASRLLTQAHIRAEIDSHRAEVIARVQADTGITLERTLREIATIAYCDLDAIRGMGLDKCRALDMLMKHLGGYESDNEQKQPPLAEAIAAFVGKLHESGGSRLPIAKPEGKAA